MAEVELTYMQDLPSAVAAQGDDLLLVHQGGAERSITMTKFVDSPNMREQWRRELADIGLTLVAGSFEAGASATSATDAVWHIAAGQCYTWGGAFPKTVPEKSTPGTTGGVVAGAWSSVGSSTLKSVLAAVDGVSLVGGGLYSGIRAYSGHLQRIKCLGRTNIFDGAIGDFVVDLTDVTSPDNDATILVDVSGRRWKRQFTTSVSPLWFGAKGDGVSDDWQALTNLFKFIGTRKDGAAGASFEHLDGNFRQIVELGNREYFVGQALKTTPTGATFTQLQGVCVRDGKIKGNGDYAVLEVTNCLWFYLDDLILVQTAMTTNAMCLDIVEWYLGRCSLRTYGGNVGINQRSANNIEYCFSIRQANYGFKYIGGGNTVANSMMSCAVERCNIVGLDFATASSTYGSFNIFNLYTEHCPVAMHSLNNNLISIYGWYMALSTAGDTGLSMDGSNVNASITIRDVYAANNSGTGQVSIVKASAGFMPKYDNIRIKTGSTNIDPILVSAPTAINIQANKAEMVFDGKFQMMDVSAVNLTSYPWFFPTAPSGPVSKAIPPSLSGTNSFTATVIELNQKIYLKANTCYRVSFSGKATGVTTAGIRILANGETVSTYAKTLTTTGVESYVEYFNTGAFTNFTLRLLNGQYSDVSIVDVSN